ncbi:hypothetical protein CF54_18240 [Streptomyces sp. Tu 6176]|nr:hypothetical protein CF54_18240 [Streptomyces sp. Tu 6176]
MFWPVPNSDLSRKPRASSEIAEPSWYWSSGSQAMEVARLVGKPVALMGQEPPSPTFLPLPRAWMPCRASFQYVYPWTPRAGMAGASLVMSWRIFWSSVIRATRSAARSSKEYRVSW